MKKTSKKIAGGILAVMLIGTIGTVVASAYPGVFSELTDEQKEEIYDLNPENGKGMTYTELPENGEGMTYTQKGLSGPYGP